MVSGFGTLECHVCVCVCVCACVRRGFTLTITQVGFEVLIDFGRVCGW